MTLKIFTVTHTKSSYGFGKGITATYPAVQFPNNKVAVDQDDGMVTVYANYDLMVNELKKTGEVKVQAQKK